MIKKLKTSTLILDYSLYPRQHIDRTKVQAMHEAIELARRATGRGGQGRLQE